MADIYAGTLVQNIGFQKNTVDESDRTLSQKRSQTVNSV